MRRGRERSVQEQLLAEVPECQLQQQVLDAARYLGYLAFHTFDSRRCEPGFPDAVLIGTGRFAGRLIVLEFKTESGRVTVEQATWLGAWMQVSGAVVRVVRPSGIDETLALLQGKEV